MNNKVIVGKWFFYIVVLWFVSGTLIGVCLEMLNLTIPYTHGPHYWIDEYIDNHLRFGWISFLYTVEIPLFFAIFWFYGFDVVAVSRPAKFALSGGLIGSSVALFGLIEAEGSNVFSRFIRFLLQELDWLGGAIIIFSTSYIFVISLVLLFKHKKEL